MNEAAQPLLIEGLRAGYTSEGPAVEVQRLALARGEAAALVGPNGAGKSTLIKAALGLVPWVEATRIEFFGTTFAAARLRVAVMPQRTDIDWDFPASALDVAAMGLSGRLGLFRRIGRDGRARALAALDAVGLASERGTQISELSGGQRQRTLLARALAQDAELLLLDEPFANVDAASEERIADALDAERARGRAILAVHHDLAGVRRRFSRVILLQRSVVADGPPSSVLVAEHLAQAYGFDLTRAERPA